MDKGYDPGLYEYFTVQDVHLAMICRIPVHGVLNDCTDQHASPGRNELRIGAEFHSGAAMWRPYFVDTLPHDRTFFSFK